MTTLITGATRGIGLALARHLAATGETVIGTYRTRPPEEGRPMRWLPLDVADPATIATLSRNLEGEVLDTLVCNAGIYPDKGQELSDGFRPELWAAAFAANVTGVFLTIQALLPNLQRARTPKIAIIASQMGSSARTSGGSYIYRASKAAAINLGYNLAVDLKGLGIAVGIYDPGWVQTDMGGSAADITAEQAANGLTERFSALTPASSGCFETWDSRSLPF